MQLYEKLDHQRTHETMTVRQAPFTGVIMIGVILSLAAACGMPNRPVTPQKTMSTAQAELNTGTFKVATVIDEDGKPKYACQKIETETENGTTSPPKYFTCQTAEIEAYRYNKEEPLSASAARKLIETTYIGHLCRAAKQEDLDKHLDAVMKDGLTADGLAVDLRWSDEGIRQGMNDFEKKCPSHEGADLQPKNEQESPKTESSVLTGDVPLLLGKSCTPSTDTKARTTATTSSELGCFFDSQSMSSFKYGLLSSLAHRILIGQTCGSEDPAEKDHKHPQSQEIGCFKSSNGEQYTWQFVTELTKNAPVAENATQQLDPAEGNSDSTSKMCVIVATNPFALQHSQNSTKSDCVKLCEESGLQQAVECSWAGTEIKVL